MQEVGQALTSSRRGVARYSAGHQAHEWTSWSARQEIFRDLSAAFTEADGDSQQTRTGTGHSGEL